MANPDHLQTLLQGVDAWNDRRAGEPLITPDLSGVDLCWGEDLSGANLSRANLSGASLCLAKLSGADLSWANLSRAHLDWANLSGANLHRADLYGADLHLANLSGANLSGVNLSWANLHSANFTRANLSRANLHIADLGEANLYGADLSEADLSKADLSKAHLNWANLSGASLNLTKLSGADLHRADLSYVSLVDADITNADLTDCRVYGVSAWGLRLNDKTSQRNLIITSQWDVSEITVDNIEVAQFIHLLLYNQKIREVIDTITSKVVLILGRFTDERKAILDALRDELRQRNYLPILFDFDKPASRTTDETIMLLARMARFVIAEISDAKSVLQELRGIVPQLPRVPVQPVIIASQEEPGMFDFYRHFPWFLPVHRYHTPAQLLAELSDRVIGPALKFRATTGAS
jgi:uncharacterized protein YjbI with pentapeptide repeats